MTIDQFIEKLRATPRDWRLIPSHEVLSGGIRRGNHDNHDYQCPMGAVLCPGKEAIRLPLEFGRDLGLSPEDSKRIRDAADNWNDYDTQLRARLLEACGL